MFHDRDVVAPGGVRNVDLLCVRVEGVQEGSADAQSASARDALGDGKLKQNR